MDSNLKVNCVRRVDDDGFTWDMAFNAVLGTLQSDNTDADWNFLLNGPNAKNSQVLFTPIGPCDDLTDADQARIKIIYQVRNAGGCGGVSCVEPQGAPTTDEAGHSVYPQYLATIKTSHIDGTSPEDIELRHHLLSHETGHILGLDDPYYLEDDLSNAYQCHLYPAWDVISVMHPNSIYGCQADGVGQTDDVEWPTEGDRLAVCLPVLPSGGNAHLDPCGGANSPPFNSPAGWPLDMNGNGIVNGSDILTFNPRFGTQSGSAFYDQRWDIRPNNLINGADILAFNISPPMLNGQPTVSSFCPYP